MAAKCSLYHHRKVGEAGQRCTFLMFFPLPSGVISTTPTLSLPNVFLALEEGLLSKGRARICPGKHQFLLFPLHPNLLPFLASPAVESCCHFNGAVGKVSTATLQTELCPHSISPTSVGGLLSRYDTSLCQPTQRSKAHPRRS